MSPDDRARFCELMPEIKSSWSQLLRDEPPLSALGRTDTVGCLMEATLLVLQTGIAQPRNTAWLEQFPPLVGTVHRYCACALGPLERYYATGESALEAVLAPALPDAMTEIRPLLRLLAAHEITILCAECTHPHWSGCELDRPKQGPAP